MAAAFNCAFNLPPCQIRRDFSPDRWLSARSQRLHNQGSPVILWLVKYFTKGSGMHAQLEAAMRS
jgi:hypothetical protein